MIHDTFFYSTGWYPIPVCLKASLITLSELSKRRIRQREQEREEDLKSERDQGDAGRIWRKKAEDGSGYGLYTLLSCMKLTKNNKIYKFYANIFNNIFIKTSNQHM